MSYYLQIVSSWCWEITNAGPVIDLFQKSMILWYVSGQVFRAPGEKHRAFFAGALSAVTLTLLLSPDQRPDQRQMKRTAQ